MEENVVLLLEREKINMKCINDEISYINKKIVHMNKYLEKLYIKKLNENIINNLNDLTKDLKIKKTVLKKNVRKKL